MKTSRQRIAVVGSGIAGLSAAWLLRHDYDVVMFEKNDYLGGHTHTINVPDNGRWLAIDTGFIVFNEPNYPHLTRLLKHLQIPSQETDMSFAVSVGKGQLEYAGDDLSTLFAQRRNLFNWEFLRMLKEILRFNAQCKELLQGDGFGDISLGAFLDRHGYSEAFRHNYLLPMGAAIWSCPTATMLSFPAASFARFFDNHGLLNLAKRPQWKTVCGGSSSYVRQMAAELQPSLHVDTPVVAVRRHTDGVDLSLANGEQLRFDQAVMACHADESLSLLQNPTDHETALLSCFQYQANRAWLHTDTSLMPRSRKVWSAWNYLAAAKDDAESDSVSVTYWMNRLQRLVAQRNYLVSLNPTQLPRQEHVIAHMMYHHPVFDQAAMQAQTKLDEIQGQDRIWFCGSYFGYGFHEDALRSSVQVASSLGTRVPWLTNTDVDPGTQAVAGMPGLVKAVS